MEQQPKSNYEKLDKEIVLDFKGRLQDWTELINELIKRYGPEKRLREVAEELRKLAKHQEIRNEDTDKDSKE